MLSIEMLERRLLLSISESTQLFATPLIAPPSDVSSVQTATTQAAGSDGAVAAPAATQAAISSVRDGLWSNPATWSGGQVPSASDDVVITNNVTIDQASARKLEINAGTTTLAGNLQAYGPVIVRGTLAGVQGGIYFHVADDRLVVGNTKAGPDATLPDFHPEDIGLWALPGSHVNLQGQQVTSWANAVGSGAVQNIGHGVTQRVAFSGGSATLQSAPVGWRAGDTLLLVNERGQSALADLLSVQGSSIQYRQRKAQATDPDLVGNQMAAEGSTLAVYPKIANLTRRIQIVGADVRKGDTNHRAFTVAMDGSTVNFSNVEFRDLGSRGKLGRYPVYFQAVSAGSMLTGSSVWQDVTDPGNRFVALAKSQGATIADNVAFRARGDGFFMENGREFGNTIAGNLSVAVSGGEELPKANSNVTQLTHHYWLRTGNTISNNVAAGGSAIGMIILASTQGGTAPVVGTEALGTGLFGIWTGTANVIFERPIAVYNSRAGFISEPAWDVDSHGATLKNPLLLFNGTNDSSYGSQIYTNEGQDTRVEGGVLAGKKAIHTHYHTSVRISNATIDVDTFMVPTYWESAVIVSGGRLRAQLLFERAYPSPRYASPGLVRFLDVLVEEDGEPPELETADYIGNTFQNYPALQGDSIPNSIELHELAADSGFIRVTTLPDSERWRSNIARWTVTPIGQTAAPLSFIYHRQTAWARLAEYGGWPDGFPPGDYEVKLYTEGGALLKSGFVTVRAGEVSDLTDTPSAHAQIVGRRLFYNQSTYDNNTAGISPSDDKAIATDKNAYLGGSGAATFANVSSYSKGINGIMIDIAGSHGAITASDFTFRTSGRFANSDPATWQTVTATPTISIRAGAGVGGADRLEIIWPNGEIANTWLEVTMRASTVTGLATPDTFYFGNLVGDSGAGNHADAAYTNSTDVIATRGHQASNLWDLNPSNTAGLAAAIQNRWDFNRDNQVDAADMLVARTGSGELAMIAIGSTPHAPATAAIASALALLNADGETTETPVSRAVDRPHDPSLKGDSTADSSARVAVFDAAPLDEVLAECAVIAKDVDDGLLAAMLADLSLD